MAEEMNDRIANNANDIACDLAKMLYKSQFAALNNTLERFHVPGRVYTLLGIRNETTCLTYDEGVWCVFFSERGLRSNEKKSNDPDTACLNLLYAMAEDKTEYQQMVRYYRNEIKNYPANAVSSADLYKTVKESLIKFAASVAVF